MQRKPKPLPRKLHLPDGIWSYQPGKVGVKIRTPDNLRSYYVKLPDLLGVPMAEIRRARGWNRLRHEWWTGCPWFGGGEFPRERPTCGDVTPAKVKDYVMRVLAGKR